MVGLAAGSKYNAVLSAAMVVVAHFLRADRSPGFLNRKLLMSGYISVLVFLLTTPYAILDWARFTNDVGWDLYHYSTGHPGLEGNGLVYLTMIGGSFSLSLLFLPFAAMYRATRAAAWIVGGFSLGYVLFLSRYPVTLAHNLLPSMPAFAVVIELGCGDWTWLWRCTLDVSEPQTCKNDGPLDLRVHTRVCGGGASRGVRRS